MALHATKTASKFDTREACRNWINDRVVRFKLKMVKARVSDNPDKFTYIPQKFDGKIINTKSGEFKETAGDEPLGKYASPTKENNKWMAVMRLQEE